MLWVKRGRPHWKIRLFQQSDQVATVLQHLSEMLSAGLGLTDALTVLSNSGLTRSRDISLALLEQLNHGKPLTNGLQNFLDPVSLSVISASEQSGTFAYVLGDFAKRLKSRTKLRQEAQKALLYPSVLLVFCCLLTVYIRGSVQPQLFSLERQLQAGYGKTTVWSLLANAVPSVVLVAFIAIPFAFFTLLWLRSRFRWRFRLPFDAFRRRVYSEQFAYRLYLQMQAGIPLVDALEVRVDELHSATVVHQYCFGALRAILSGMRLSDGMQDVDVTVKQLVFVAEETGNIVQALEQASDILQEQIRLQMDRLVNWMEPAATCVLGVVVGATVYNVFGPMYQVISQIGQSNYA